MHSTLMYNLPKFTSFPYFSHLLDYVLHTHTHTHTHTSHKKYFGSYLSVDHMHHSFLSLNSSVCVPNEGISYNHNTDFNFSKFKLTQFYLIYHEYSNVVN